MIIVTRCSKILSIMFRQLVSLKNFHCRLPWVPRQLHAKTTLNAFASSSQAPKYSDLSGEQQIQIDRYLDTLLDWNERMNLTGTSIEFPLLMHPSLTTKNQYYFSTCAAITDRTEVYTRHVDDSLSLLPILDECVAQLQSSPSLTSAITLCDVGSGAGLPGSIIAIARPHWHITLLDSLQKRCNFNAAATSAADLSNISIEWARAEDAGRNPLLRDTQTLVVARAVAELRVLAEFCLPLTTVGGYWIAAKGANPDEEVEAAQRAIAELGGRLLSVVEVDSIGPEGRRTAVVVKKERETPKKYPRKPGMPKKQPL